jgi:hypothetical protein
LSTANERESNQDQAKVHKKTSPVTELSAKAEDTSVLLPERLLIVVDADVMHLFSHCFFRDFGEGSEASVG